MVPNLPDFYALIADDARQVLYGSDINNGKLYILSMKDGSPIESFLLGADQWSRPTGMDMSPDGSQLAVALGTGQTVVVDLKTRTIVQRITYVGRYSNAVFDIRYGRPGRLYAVGDYFMHVIDTATGKEVAVTSNPIPAITPRLSISADKRWLFMMDGNVEANVLVRWDVSTDSPVETDAPHGNAMGFQAVVRPDGSQVYTTSGQVWSPSLDHMLGNFDGFQTYGADARTLTYVPATDRIFAGCDCYGVQEIRADSFPYSVIGDRQLHGIPTAITTNAAGTMLYVSSSVPWNPTTGNGASQIEIFNLSAPPQPRARANTGASPQPLFDSLLFDSNRHLLYGSDPVGGWVKVLSPGTGNWVASIDVGQYDQPFGMDISPDGSQLAVALANAAQILVIDLDSRSYAEHLYPLGVTGENQPFDVRYGRQGRLYSVGAGGAQAMDYLHAFDTTTGVQVARSTQSVRLDPRLAISADRMALFVMESNEIPQTLSRFDVSTDALTATASTSGNQGVPGYEIAVRSDGTQVYTSGSNIGNGQVWSSDLTTQTGSIADRGPDIAYSAVAGRVFIGNGHGVSEFVDSAPYTAVHTWTQTGTNNNTGKTGPVAISPDGLTIYLSTDSGVVIIPRGQPIPPTNVVAKAGDGQATVSWTAPAITGSTPITSYTITEWRFIAPPLTFTFNSPATSEVITGLTNGAGYQFNVTATNSQGSSDPSAWSNVIFPGHPPASPTNVTATAGNAQATVAWNAPSDTGGVPISGYRVTSYIGGAAQQSYELPWTSGSPPSMTITNLTNGQAYTFTVAAENDVGTSPESSPSNEVVPHA